MATIERQLVLVGGGGHAKVVADAARSSGWAVVGFFDDGPADPPFPLSVCGVPCLGPVPTDPNRMQHQALFIAVGNNAARNRLAQSIWPGSEGSHGPAAPDHVTVIHSSAEVSPSARVSQGTLIGPRAVVNADAIIERDCIVNSGAIVEHDCRIGTAAHIAPGVVLGGAVHIGTLTLVGLGARVLPGVRIGNRCIIGAGAVVTADVPDGTTTVGVPARVMGRKCGKGGSTSETDSPPESRSRSHRGLC